MFIIHSIVTVAKSFSGRINPLRVRLLSGSLLHNSLCFSTGFISVGII
uniref:Uncharacterized protein n=1 Tax=Arundo donax TaxID=35708 RepID=A0A0A8Z902_ARUDO